MELKRRLYSASSRVARSGFYFYFDSKYAVLAHLIGEAGQELGGLAELFAARTLGQVAGDDDQIRFQTAQRRSAAAADRAARPKQPCS